MMDQVIIYIHGQGGNADEAKHYESLFENQKVIGIDYKSETPWEAAEEFRKLYDALVGKHKSVSKFAKQIGAKLTVMKNGEHWFHTEEQMSFLDDWISKIIS